MKRSMIRDGKETVLAGTVIYGDEFKIIEGYVCIRDGIIKEVGREKVEADIEGIICPRFVNAHTHIGDSVFKDPPYMPLNELVGPGGLKHRVLAGTPNHVLVEGMKRTIRDMVSTGTFAFADFREGGLGGVDLLLMALGDMPVLAMPVLAKIFGRPDEGSAEIHDECFGLGISSTRDHSLKTIQEAVSLAKSKGKALAIHAGELGADDIEDALSLDPDFLVHMNRASGGELEKAAKAEVPVVVCPRSNLVTGVGLPDVRRMIDLGITVGAGTDNVMINSPNMFSEMELISKALLHDDRQVFKMCTLNGARILGVDKKIGSIYEGKDGRVMVLDGSSDNLRGSSDILSSIVRRARPTDIKAII